MLGFCASMDGDGWVFRHRLGPNVLWPRLVVLGTESEAWTRSGDAWARNGEAWTRNGEASARYRESWAGSGEGWARNGEGWPRNGEGWARNGEAWARNGEAWAGSGEGWAGMAPNGERWRQWRAMAPMARFAPKIMKNDKFCFKIHENLAKKP